MGLSDAVQQFRDGFVLYDLGDIFVFCRGFQANNKDIGFSVTLDIKMVFGVLVPSAFEKQFPTRFSVADHWGNISDSMIAFLFFLGVEKLFCAAVVVCGE